MYFVKYGKEYLHDPRVKGFTLLDLSLQGEENSCGYCDFTMYPDHPMYDKIKERDADNPIEVYDDDILLFSGFIYELGKEFYLNGTVKCKGELDYLNESIVRPYSTLQRGYGDKAPDSVSKYFSWLISKHNEQVGLNKQFVVGVNQASSLDDNNYIYRENNNYPTTIDEISEKLLKNENIGGYLSVRHENGIRYIDYYAEWDKTNTQILDFGVNLTDYTQTDDSADIATFIIPLGARMSETEYSYNDGYSVTTDTSVDESKVYYTKSFSEFHYCGYITRFESDKTYYEFDISKVRFYVTSDSTVNPNKVYYTKSDDGKYYECSSLTSFEQGTTYYEYDDGFYVTSDTKVNTSKDYYTPKYTYSQCSDLAAFESGVTYYEYNEDNDESDLSLTLKGLDDGRYYTGEDYVKSGDIVYCESAVEKYGPIGTTYKNEDITLREHLAAKAAIALKELVSPKRTIEIKAVDMHLINPDIRPIQIGEYVRVRSKPHNLDSYFLCTSIDLDLNNPENSVYTLGTTFDTLTGQQNKQIKLFNSSINQTYERAEELSTKQKENAKSIVDALKRLKEAENTADTAKNTATDAKSSTIVKVIDEYAISDSTTDAPQTEAWSREIPSWEEGKFIWRRFIYVYGDGHEEIGTPSLSTGGSGKDGEDAVTLRIESSRGTVFKNDQVSTVLSVVIYQGSNRITNSAAMKSTFGNSAYLQWKWQRLDDETFGIISSGDSRFSDNGFKFTLSPDDVDTKVTFMCELIV